MHGSKQCNKISYQKPLQALKAMQQMLHKGIMFEKIGMYKCDKCFNWHISTKKLYT